MNYYAMTDSAIETELGARLAAHRLRRDITQDEVASALGISRMTYNSLEKGKGKISTLIGAMRYLECLDQLDAFLPAPGFSPLAARKLRGKERKRATRTFFESMRVFIEKGENTTSESKKENW